MKPLENHINQLLNVAVKLQAAIDHNRIPPEKADKGRLYLKQTTVHLNKICKFLEVS